MMQYRVLVIFLALFVCLTLGASNAGEQPPPSRNKLVVLMLGGCRWDYFSRDEESHSGFKTIKDEGVVAEYGQPIFPSVGYPSWTTIATGLYPAEHGLVGDYIYKRDTKKEFNLNVDMSTNDTMFWTEHIPIWTTLTNENLNVSLHHWSRCDVPFVIGKKITITPEKCTPYLDAEKMSDKPHVLNASLSEAITDLKEGFDVAFVYYTGMDVKGHQHGPDSDDIIQEVKDIDAVILQFLEDLKAEEMAIMTNFIIVADHGMTYNDDKTFEKLSDYVDDPSTDIERIVNWGAFSHIAVTKPELIGAVFDKLNTSLEGMMDVYKKEDIPNYLHFNHSDILDILLVSRGNVLSGPDEEFADLYLPPTVTDSEIKGSHGYNDISDGYSTEGDFPDMRTIFMAVGPDFKANHTHQWIKLVDEYQIFMKVLNVNARSHSGNWDRVKDMLFKADDDDGDNGSTTALSNGILMLTMFVLVSLVVMEN